MDRKLKFLFGAVILLSFLGFLDSAYLTFKHYQGTPLECVVFEGCNEVARSPYAVVFGIPLALFGVIYYLALFFFAIFTFEFRQFKILKIILPATFLGFLASLYFLYLQIFVIKALCVYCLFSLFASTSLFILILVIIKIINKNKFLWKQSLSF